MTTFAVAIRAGLDAFGLRTCLFICNSQDHVWEVLSGQIPDCDHIIFVCHGDRSGNLLFDVYPKTQVDVKMIERKALLSDKFILSLGCSTGDGNLARDFLKVGCRGFVGPNGNPHVHTGYLFILMFYRYLLQHFGMGVDEAKLTEREAFEAAKKFHVELNSREARKSASKLLIPFHHVRTFHSSSLAPGNR